MLDAFFLVFLGWFYSGVLPNPQWGTSHKLTTSSINIWGFYSGVFPKPSMNLKFIKLTLFIIRGFLFGGSPQTLNEITHQVYIIWHEYRGILSGSVPQTLDEELLTSSQHQVSTFGDFIRGCSPNPQWILNSSSLHYLPYMGILFGGTPQTLNELIDSSKLQLSLIAVDKKWMKTNRHKASKKF